MRATRGLAVSVRRRGRLAGCCIALVLIVGALVAPSMANATLPPVNQQYLALGDSLAFGYSSQLYHEGEEKSFEDPENFEHGYANDLFKVLKGKAVKEGGNLRLVNDGCPGETSEGLIGSSGSLIGTLNFALKKSQEENGLPPVKGVTGKPSEAGPPHWQVPCEYQAVWNALKTDGLGGPLHHPYSGSQLEDAIATLATAANVEHKPVTTITLNIGANDELHSLGKVEAEAKAFVEAKVKKVGQEAVEAKLKKVGQEAVEAKLKKVGEEAVEAKLKVVAEEAIAAKLKVKAEEAIGAKLKVVAEEAINAKVAEAVFIKCSEKAFAETGGEEPAFAEARENCLATEGEKLGGEYFFEHKAELEKEGEEAAGKYFFEHKAELEKEGEEAAFAYFAAHKAEVEKEGEEAAFAYFAAHKAEVEKEGEEAALKYFAEHKFELGKEGEIYGAELVGKAAPGLIKQIASNISGILLALRDGGSLGLDGGKAVNYTGKIIFQGGYNPFGKQFHFAFEGVQFVEEHGGLAGPYASVTGRCTVRGITQKQEEEKIAAGCTASELQPGFSSLVKTFNEVEHSTVLGFGACMSFPANVFNNGSQTLEPEDLKNWTNMTNGTSNNGKPNGPDIHPTPAGYTQLEKEMVKEANGKCKKAGLPGF